MLLETVIITDPWKPSDPVLTENAIFAVGDDVLTADAPLCLTAGAKVAVRIDLPQLDGTVVEGESIILKILILLPDGTPVTGNSIIARGVKSPDGHLKIRVEEFPLPVKAGKKWQFAAYTNTNRPIAYSPMLTIN